MKRYCQNCGFENADKNKFCMKCGLELMNVKSESNVPTEPIAQPNYELQKPIKQPREKKFVKPGKIVLTSNKMISGLALGAIVLSILAILLAILFNPVTLGSGAVGQQQLANNSVTNAKVADGSINNAKIADDSIDSDNLIDSSILLEDLSLSTISNLTGLNVIANDSITGDKIANFSITESDLENSSITSQKIVDGTITSSDLGSNSVGSDEIASGAVGSSEIADGTVSYDDMKIKIKYSSTSAYNGSSIAHGISAGSPTCVVVTPIYNSASYANATIIANVYNVGATYFYLTLYYQYPDGVLTPVPSGTPVTVYWIAIYTS